jgi:hypothetical protein
MAVPTITSLTPSAGPATGGTSVAVVGTGFTGTTGVTVGGTAATSFNVVDDTHLTVVTEAHAAGAANLVVTNGTGASAPSTFTYVAAPTVTSVTPATEEEAGGDSIAIVGTNFTGATSVKFGTTQAAFTVVDATHITATDPGHGAGVVDVTVTTVGGTSATSSADHFTYTAPVGATYTQPDGTADDTYFMDIAINPANLKDGSLLQRFDPVVYPTLGVVSLPKQGDADFPPSAPDLGPDV